SVYYLLAFLCLPSHPTYLLSFSFHDPPTSELYTLSLHDALPISSSSPSKIHQKVNGSKSTQAITDSLSVIQKEKKTLPNINMNHGTYDMSERRQLKKSCKKTSRLKNM